MPELRAGSWPRPAGSDYHPGMAVQDAVKQAGPTILEPIMKIEVTTPDEFLGSIIGDLSAKRAQILGTEPRGTVTIVTAHAPLSELSGYATIIRSLTQGRATFYMEPSHYAEVPKNLQEKLRVDKTN